MAYEFNNHLKYIQRNNSQNTKLTYKQKLIILKQMIREYVHENSALVDEIEEAQINIIIRKEERKFLLRKLCEYEPQVAAEVQKAAKDSNSPRHNSSEIKKRKKKITDNTGRLFKTFSNST